MGGGDWGRKRPAENSDGCSRRARFALGEGPYTSLGEGPYTSLGEARYAFGGVNGWVIDTLWSVKNRGPSSVM